MMSKLKYLVAGVLFVAIADQADAQSVVLASNNTYVSNEVSGETRTIAPAKPAAVPALIATISEGHIIDAKEMMDNGTDIKATDANGETALHTAARMGYIELVKKLVREGADVDARNNQGQTALDVVHETKYKFPREPRVIARVLEDEMKK